jgi:hypothetical protein
MTDGEERRKLDRDDELHVIGPVEHLRKIAVKLDGEQAMVGFAIGGSKCDVGAFPDQIDCDHFLPVVLRQTGLHLGPDWHQPRKTLRNRADRL